MTVSACPWTISRCHTHMSVMRLYAVQWLWLLGHGQGYLRWCSPSRYSYMPESAWHSCAWQLLMVHGQAETVVAACLLGAARTIDKGAHGLSLEL